MFDAGAACHVAGAGHLALAARGLEWATGAQRAPRFRVPAPRRREGGDQSPSLRPRVWIVLRAHRGVGESVPPHGAPTFAIGGLHLAPNLGWRVLPGPLGCPHLATFAMGSALAAYQTSLARRGTPPR